MGCGLADKEASRPISLVDDECFGKKSSSVEVGAGLARGMVRQIGMKGMMGLTRKERAWKTKAML